MKSQNASLIKIRLLLLLGLAVMSPFLYAQCISSQSCLHVFPGGTCAGSPPEKNLYGSDSEWLEGFAPCGTIWDQNGQNTHIQCGDAQINGTCA